MVRSVLLVGPYSKQGTYTNPPTGLLYLHAMLRANDVPVDWVDENQHDVIDVTQHDIIGIQMMTSNRHRALHIAKAAKDAGKFVVVGGPHPTLMWKQVLENYPYIDLCVIGDGEYPLLDIAQGKQPAFIPGVAWRNGREIAHTTRNLNWSLDALPLPSFDAVDFSRYVGGARVFYSRGCGHGKCIFCSVAAQWGPQRWRSVDNMIQEMQWLKDLGQSGFALYDDCMTCDRDRAAALFQAMIDNDLTGMWWCCTTRVSAVDPDIIALMKRAGCQEVTFGVETAHPEAMKIYAKGQTVEQAENAIAWCKQVGLRCSVLMIYNGIRAGQYDGFTKQWVAKMGVGEGSANELQIFPATPLYRAMVDHGFMDDSFWLGPEPFGIYHGQLDHLEPRDWAKYHVC